MSATDASRVQHTSESAIADNSDFRLEAWQRENAVRLSFVDKEMSRRLCGGPVLAGGKDDECVVDYSAKARYFWLLKVARQEMTGLFSRAEIIIMLNANPRPLWNDGFETDVATGVADDQGLDEDSITGTPYEALCRKLCQLSYTQRVALLDVLECAWRDRTVGPEKYALNELNSPDQRFMYL